MTQAEVAEARFGLRVERYCLDPLGAGRRPHARRSGLHPGVPDPARRLDRHLDSRASRIPGLGLARRRGRTTNHVDVVKPDGTVTRFGKVARHPLSEGDLVRVATGGGYGPPLERAPEAVAEDVKVRHGRAGARGLRRRGRRVHVRGRRGARQVEAGRVSHDRERARELREAVARRRDELFELAAELVRRPSLLGAEEDAQPRGGVAPRRAASPSSGSSRTRPQRSPIRMPATRHSHTRAAAASSSAPSPGPVRAGRSI